MFHNIFKFLSEFVKDEALGSCDTYVLATTIDNPASLFIDDTLADSTEGFYICSEDQPWNSAVAYIDVSNLNSEEAKRAVGIFLKSLQEEVKKTGKLTKRGNWNEF